MNHPIASHSTKRPIPTGDTPTLNPAKLKEPKHKFQSCPHRNSKGWCSRSQRPCPATLFTVTFKQ